MPLVIVRGFRPAAVFVALAALAALAAPAALLAQSRTPLEARVDSVFSAFDHTTTPGCVVGADRAGAPLVRRAYGMADLETGTPFTLGSLSESGSTAKQFTAASLVMLALDGVLALDDDVAKWVPEVKGFGKRITIRQLLSHTSGIPDRYGLHDAMGRPAEQTDHTNAEVLEIVSHLRDLNFDPGEDYLYSNSGYLVAVAVLERASGMSLAAFTQARIFGPLGMTHTRWREDHRVVVPGRAAAYSGTLATGFRNEHPFTRVYGSGGLLLTIDDFLTWSAAFQLGSGRWGAIRDSMSAVIHLNDGTAITYGLGVSTAQWRGVRRVSHTGATGGYRAALARLPDQQLSVALLCNVASANPGVLADRVSAAVLGDLLVAAPVEPTAAADVTPADLAALAGRYHAPRTEDVMVLEVRNGQLVDSLNDATMIALGANRFRQRGAPSDLQFSRTGTAVTIRETAPNARAVDYVRMEAPTASATALAAYVGSYASPELGATVTLVAHGDTLLMAQGWRGTLPLRPLYRDGFGSDNQLLRFVRDARGRVTGFVANSGRVRRLRFERVKER